MSLTIGAHMSIAGGFTKSLDRIAAIGGNSLQIFSASPRGWNFADISDEECSEFKEKKNTLGIDSVYFHASYLINLANNEKTGTLSKKTLITEMTLQPKMGIKGSVVHPGSFKKKITDDGLFPEKDAYAVLIDNIQEVLDNTPEDSLLLIENAGMRKIGRTIEEIARIMSELKNDRIRVCLDTCHLHAAGYDLTTPDSFDTFFSEFDKMIGLNNLELIHINDSKDPFGSLRDRHENIGHGNVGETVFKRLVTDKRTKDLPFILETPGFDGKGPDKKNIDIIKSYAKRSA